MTYIAGRFFESRLTLYEMCWHLRLFMSTFHFLLSHSFSQQWRLKANTRKSFIIYLFSGSMGGNVVHWPWLSVYLPRTTKDLQKDLQRPFQCWLILNIILCQQWVRCEFSQKNTICSRETNKHCVQTLKWKSNDENATAGEIWGVWRVKRSQEEKSVSEDIILEVRLIWASFRTRPSKEN